jgi:hypothetical protein
MKNSHARLVAAKANRDGRSSRRVGRRVGLLGLIADPRQIAVRQPRHERIG